MESKIPSIDSGEQFKNHLLSSAYCDTLNSTSSTVFPVPSLSFLIKISPPKNMIEKDIVKSDHLADSLIVEVI